MIGSRKINSLLPNEWELDGCVIHLNLRQGKSTLIYDIYLYVLNGVESFLNFSGRFSPDYTSNETRCVRIVSQIRRGSVALKQELPHYT